MDPTGMLDAVPGVNITTKKAYFYGDIWALGPGGGGGGLGEILTGILAFIGSVFSPNSTSPTGPEPETQSDGGEDNKGCKDLNLYKRPTHYRKGMRDEVWENAKDSNGDVKDPTTGAVINKNEPWHMGHKTGYEFWKHVISACERGLTREEFLAEYMNPDHYRPELPESNQSHQGEDKSDNYEGP